MLEVPIISENEDWSTSAIYAWDTYNLIEMSTENVLKMVWTNNDNTSEWALAINEKNIWHYWIKNNYLQYAIIQEILCPDMTEWDVINSIEVEIETVPEDIYTNYVSWRITFFEKMNDYWNNLSEDDLIKVNASEEDKRVYSENIIKIINYLKWL